MEARLRACMATWQRLKPLWSHSVSPDRHKIQLWNAILRAKLLYGLESLHMTKT